MRNHADAIANWLNKVRKSVRSLFADLACESGDPEFLWRKLSEQPGSARQPKTACRHWIDRLQAADDCETRKLLYHSQVRSTGEPLLLRREAFEGHAIIFGGTGARKTSLGLLPLIVQLIRGYRDSAGRWPHESAEAGPEPVIIIDPKGDNSLFYTAWNEANEAKRAFRYFSLGEGDDYYLFDPFSTLCPSWNQHLRPEDLDTARSDINGVEVASLFLDALGLHHGSEYGKSHYTFQNFTPLLIALNRFSHSADSINPNYVRNFQRLFLEAVKIRKDRSWNMMSNEFEQLLNTLLLLSHYPQIDAAIHDEPPRSIDLEGALLRGDVLYFKLEADRNSLAAEVIGRLILTCLVTLAANLKKRGHCLPNIWVPVDEFWVIATPAFKRILSLARSSGLRLILATQSAEQMYNRDVPLARIVKENTAFKQSFTIRDREHLAELLELSGEEIEELLSSSHSEGASGDRGTLSDTETKRQVYRSSLSRDELLDASHEATWSIVQIDSQNSCPTLSRPTVVVSDYVIDEATYAQRLRTPWPEGVPIPPKPKPEPTTKRRRKRKSKGKAKESEAGNEDATLFDDIPKSDEAADQQERLRKWKGRGKPDA